MRSRGRPVSFVVAAALALAACEEERDYRVVVRFEDDALAERADRLELSLLGACDEVALGAPPDDPLRRFDVEAGELPAAFGEVDPGSHGLYARAFDEDACAVVGAGCATVEVERGGGGDLVVVIGTIPAIACPGGTTCREGRCMPIDVEVDAGLRPDAGAGVDAGPDLPLGERWVDVPCTYESQGCGDALRGYAATCRATDSGARCCAGCYERGSQRCEPGWTDQACGWGGNACRACDVDQSCTSYYVYVQINQCQ
jgi:hypothetical protein